MGRVIAESRCSESEILGSGRTCPNPVMRPMPTQPDHTATAAGAASRTSGQDRTGPLRDRRGRLVRARAGSGSVHGPFGLAVADRVLDRPDRDASVVVVRRHRSAPVGTGGSAGGSSDVIGRLTLLHMASGRSVATRASKPRLWSCWLCGFDHGTSRAAALGKMIVRHAAPP